MRWVRSQRGGQTECGQRTPREENEREAKGRGRRGQDGRIIGKAAGGRNTVFWGSLGWGLESVKLWKDIGTCATESLEASTCFSVLIGAIDPCMSLTAVRNDSFRREKLARIWGMEFPLDL